MRKKQSALSWMDRCALCQTGTLGVTSFRYRGCDAMDRCCLQVDRLEQELVDLRREKEAQDAAAGARAQATGHLEEYRTRAQQALKRANEITTQTTSEKKRLEVERERVTNEFLKTKSSRSIPMAALLLSLPLLD